MTILDTIVEEKRREVAHLPQHRVAARELHLALQARGEIRDFAAALCHPKAGPVALIAEVKKASPSKGVLREDFDPLSIARTYQQHGASAVSVLTDRTYFQGSLEDLRAIKELVRLPALNKEFMVDELQFYEARAHLADAALPGIS